MAMDVLERDSIYEDTFAAVVDHAVRSELANHYEGLLRPSFGGQTPDKATVRQTYGAFYDALSQAFPADEVHFDREQAVGVLADAWWQDFEETKALVQHAEDDPSDSIGKQKASRDSQLPRPVKGSRQLTVANEWYACGDEGTAYPASRSHIVLRSVCPRA